MKPEIMCLIVLSCAEDSEQSRKEIEEIIGVLKKTSWNIERITVLEDRRNAL